MRAAISVLDNPLALAFNESFTIELGWNDFSAQLSLLLALDEAGIKALELGQLAKIASAECIGLVIYFFGSGAAKLDGSLDLEIAGLFDALLESVGKIVNVLAVPLSSVAPQIIGDGPVVARGEVEHFGGKTGAQAG